MAIDLEGRRRQLNILVGVWDTTITPIEQDGSLGEPTQAIDAYSCSLSMTSTSIWVDSECNRWKFWRSSLRRAST